MSCLAWVKDKILTEFETNAICLLVWSPEMPVQCINEQKDFRGDSSAPDHTCRVIPCLTAALPGSCRGKRNKHRKCSGSNLCTGKASTLYASENFSLCSVGVCIPSEKEWRGSYLRWLSQVMDMSFLNLPERRVSLVSPAGRRYENKTRTHLPPLTEHNHIF